MSQSRAELGELVTHISRQLRRSLRGQGVPPHHFRVLRVVAERPIRPARLAEVLNITPRAVTDVVDALVEAGLITSEPDPEDRRAKVLSITEAGERRNAEVKALRDAAAEQMFAPLADNERETLARLLRKVVVENKQGEYSGS